MRSAQTRGLMEQDQAVRFAVEACGDRTQAGQSVGWFRRLFQGLVRPSRNHRHAFSLLDERWDAQHEQVRVQTADSPRDIIATQSGPDLRMVMQHHLFLS